MKRRNFLKSTAGATVAATMLTNPVSATIASKSKRRIALVGTGVRGTSFWGRTVIERYGDIVEYVALCDINPGRLDYALEYMDIYRD